MAAARPNEIKPVLQAILDMGPQWDEPRKTKEEVDAILTAAYKKNSSIKNASKDENGDTSLIWAARNYNLYALMWLLDRNFLYRPDINDIVPSSGQSALSISVQYKDSGVKSETSSTLWRRSCVNFLLKNDADAFMGDGLALKLAAKFGSVHFLNHVLEEGQYGAILTNQFFKEIIAEAIRLNQVKIFSYLISAARKRLVDIELLDPLAAVIELYRTNAQAALHFQTLLFASDIHFKQRHLVLAAKLNLLPIVKTLVEQHRIPVSPESLQEAFLINSYPIASYLLETAQDPNVINLYSQGQKPSYLYAFEGASVPMVTLALRRGANFAAFQKKHKNQNYFNFTNENVKNFILAYENILMQNAAENKVAHSEEMRGLIQKLQPVDIKDLRLLVKDAPIQVEYFNQFIPADILAEIAADAAAPAAAAAAQPVYYGDPEGVPHPHLGREGEPNPSVMLASEAEEGKAHGSGQVFQYQNVDSFEAEPGAPASASSSSSIAPTQALFTPKSPQGAKPKMSDAELLTFIAKLTTTENALPDILRDNLIEFSKKLTEGNVVNDNKMLK
ncbi:MAG: hypothetical protein P4M14_07575 [Gammaproteobacteria bacterium]|nr:hypothetical protein [Gammaproteobacteria bacterium]